MSSKLEAYLEIARTYQISAVELEAQRRSFAYGNTHFENELITRAMVDKAAEDLQSNNAPDRHTPR